MSIFRFAFSLAASLILTRSACALSLDAFVDDGSVSSTSTVGATRNIYLSSSHAIGGGRSLSATKSGPGTGVSRLEVVDSSLGYTQGAHAGFGSVVWDGNTDPSTITPNGLGAIDLTQDAGTAFKIGLEFFDYPSNQPVQLKLRLYDATTLDGSRFSEVSITLDQFYAEAEPFFITVPYTMFTSPGSSTVPAPSNLRFSTTTTIGTGGAVDVTRVGAISLSFRGDLNARAPDIILAPFMTNGTCSSVPDTNGRAIDECSVCHESVDSNKGKDRCGICLAGPAGYSYDSNKILDRCGLCPGEAFFQFPSGTIDKCGTCRNAPAPYTYVDRRDVCGVCDGPTKKVEDCTIGLNGCPLVKPTQKILAFERSVIEKASRLRDRYDADVRRAQLKRCGINFKGSKKKIASAYATITKNAQTIFRRGIEVCTGNCVTVSYANEVKSLTPQFTILENEAAAAAKKVQTCYKRLGIVMSPAGSRGRGTDNTISAVRAELGNLIRECSKTNVCKHN